MTPEDRIKLNAYMDARRHELCFGWKEISFLTPWNAITVQRKYGEALHRLGYIHLRRIGRPPAAVWTVFGYKVYLRWFFNEALRLEGRPGNAKVLKRREFALPPEMPKPHGRVAQNPTPTTGEEKE